MPWTPVSQSFNDGIAMDAMPRVRIDEDTFFTSMRNALRKAKPPDSAEAGSNGPAPRVSEHEEDLTQPWPSETTQQLDASRRDWTTTW